MLCVFCHFNSSSRVTPRTAVPRVCVLCNKLGTCYHQYYVARLSGKWRFLDLMTVRMKVALIFCNSGPFVLNKNAGKIFKIHTHWHQPKIQCFKRWAFYPQLMKRMWLFSTVCKSTINKTRICQLISKRKNCLMTNFSYVLLYGFTCSHNSSCWNKNKRPHQATQARHCKYKLEKCMLANTRKKLERLDATGR